MTCSSCGSALEAGATKCPACGTAVPAPVVQNTSVSGRLKAVTLREEKTVNPIRVDDVLSGRYRLIAKIGEGGMGTVFTAYDQELDRQVAIKLLAANLVNEADVVERFEREAKLTAKLDHPNIVPIYDVGRHEGRPFIVMKLLVGDTLAGVLREKGGFTSEETVKLLKQIAAGLDYIHAQGFIHRDIKAGNIFVAPDGLATILDFGILRSRAATQGLTRTGMVMGTPHYMAPEQAMGLKDVDHRVDIYALAVVLFECLTGTLPFEADSELRLIQMQAHSPPPDIIDRAPWITRPVADVVRRALAKRPEERFNTAAELVKALETAYRESKGHEAAPRQPPQPLASPGIGQSTAPSLRKLAQDDLPIVPALPEPPAREADDDLPPVTRRTPWPALLALLLVVATGAVVWRVMSVDDSHVTTPDAGLVAVERVDAGVEVAAVDDAGLGTDDAGALALFDVDAGTDDSDDDDAGVVSSTAIRPVQVRPVKKNGGVNILSFHEGERYWAQVSIDGVPRGRTPLRLDLPVGSHHVVVERPGFKSEAREIRVASGKTTSLLFELKP